jgi:hypothetical protein
METPKFITNIDWTDLRTQKTLLLETINNDAVDPEHKEGLEGILALIDALQDYAVDELGVDEMHVFDFELEEEREQSTPEENFARESAEKIFDELCESDGFHQEDDMSEEFISSVMADRFQSDIIKALIRAQIINDLKENPKAFQYDSKNVPIYDSNMREDYEGLVINYIRERFNSGKTKTLWLCPHCGSDNVQHKALVNANSNEILDGDVDTDEDGYCNDCEQSGELLTQELPLYKKVIGYQVVGKEDHENEGDIHPLMDASFSLYSLSQAKEMLEDDNTMYKGEWKLLTIWSGDVEEPTMMFEGDPRG